MTSKKYQEFEKELLDVIAYARTKGFNIKEVGVIALKKRDLVIFPNKLFGVRLNEYAK